MDIIPANIPHRQYDQILIPTFLKAFKISLLEDNEEARKKMDFANFELFASFLIF